MKREDLFYLKDFLIANKHKNLSEVDYIHAIFKLAELPTDLLFCFLKLLAPDFKVVNGLVFLSESFIREDFDAFISLGKDASEIQLWLNLIEITGIFENLNEDDALQVGNSIAEIWNLKLQNEKLVAVGKARVIHEVDDGEIYITIDQGIKNSETPVFQSGK